MNPPFNRGHRDYYLGPAAKLVERLRRSGEADSSRFTPLNPTDFSVGHFHDIEHGGIEAMVAGWNAWISFSLEPSDDLLAKIITCFNKCWTADNENRRLPRPTADEEIENSLYSRLHRICKYDTPGFWIALDRTIEKSNGKLEIQSESEIRVPLVSGSIGAIGVMKIERIAQGGNSLVLYPDPFAVGLAYIGQDTGTGENLQKDHGWLKSFDNARRAAQGAPGALGNFRYRWSLKTLGKSDNPTDANRLHVERFGGRSAEAAVACGIWAASGLVSEDGVELIADSGFEFDPTISISAQLDMQSLSGTSTPLMTIEGLPQKVKSAVDVGIDLLIVASGWEKNVPEGSSETDKEVIDRWLKETENKIDIIGVSTLGEAYQIMTSGYRILKTHHAAISKAWLRQWDKDPETGLSSGIWTGSDEYQQAVAAARTKAEQESDTGAQPMEEE